MATPKTVFVVDDHPVVSMGIRMLLEEESDLEFCGCAAKVLDAISMTAKSKPDLIVLDLVLGGRDRLDLLREIRTASPDSAILIYSSLEEDTYAARVLRLGASGFLHKSELPEKMLQALRIVGAGEIFASPATLKKIAQASGEKPHLSDRELHIFRLLGDGHRPRAIAEDLSLSVKTVQTYCERLKEKLGVSSLPELLNLAREDRDTP